MAPRLHFAYDLTGDGKTVIKGGWGRFDYIRTVRPDFERLNANTDAVAIYNWRDLNGNGDYNPGEVNLDPNGPDFVETLGNELDEPAPRAIPNPNEKQPKVRRVLDLAGAGGGLEFRRPGRRNPLALQQHPPGAEQPAALRGL